MVLYIIVLMLVIVLAYTWVGYPLILRVIASRNMGADNVPATDALLSVAVVLSAYNEEEHLRARIENLLSLDYPGGGSINIYIGLDGCSDASASIAKELSGVCDNINVCDFSERRGKVAVIKDLVASAVGDLGDDLILLFTDANTMFKNDVLFKLLRHFGDENIGGACGRLVFLPAVSEECGTGGGTESPEASYWGWETRLKMTESSLDSCLGANGAIYAMRAKLFWDDMPDNTLIDDFVLGMKIREQGLRLIYEPDAIAEEELPEQAAEWARRVRIGAGDYQALGYCKQCLLPRYGKFAWMFWSHKVLRWFSPHLLLLLLVLVLYLLAAFSGTGREWVLSGVGLLVIIMLAAMYSAKNTDLGRLKIMKLFLLFEHFIIMQAALFVGFIRYCRGGLVGHWARTPRK